MDSEFLRIEITRQGYCGTQYITVKETGENVFEVDFGTGTVEVFPALYLALNHVSENLKYIDLSPLHMPNGEKLDLVYDESDVYPEF
jgi:hypothetical protein